MKVHLHKMWCDHGAKGLAETLRNDEALFKAQVNQGIAQLWEINTEQGKSWLITRVEQTPNHKELVVCCYKGCDLKQVTQVIYECAEKQGFDSIRYHTQRKGLNRLVVDLGFMPYETVYRKELRG